MKIIFLLLLIPAIAKSQLYIGVSAGTYKGVIKEIDANNRYILGVHAGYKLSIFFVEGEERIDLLTKKVSNNCFGIKSGLNIPINKVTISPFVGYFFNYVSADNRYLNIYYTSYGLRVNYLLTNSQIYLEGININTNQLTVGFSYNINFKDE